MHRGVMDVGSRRALLLGSKRPCASRRPPAIPSPQQRTGRAQALLAAQPKDTVEVPLDFYKLLQVSRVASRETVTKAFDECLSRPPDAGYSQQALLARGSILRGAVDTLLEPSLRKEYDERLVVGDVVEEVPQEYVAGALALLQEAGEAAAVVSAGEAWLAAHRRSTGSEDVGLAVALARCDLAQAALEGQGDVVQAVSHLEAALAVLKQHRPAAGDLLRDIAATLQELQPQLALALLALPLEASEQRARGLGVAQAVLQGAGAGKGYVIGKAEFVQQLAGCLTAEEQIKLYEACGAAFAESGSELYDVAMAYISQGASSLDPAALRKAVALLLQPAAMAPDVPESQRERRAAEERNKRSVALAVCHLLLGAPEAAEAALGLAPAGERDAGASAAPKCDRVVLQFIKANSPDRSDLLPGLCVLAQRWTHDVAFASFRAPHDVAFSLDSWFAAPQVQAALKAGEQGAGADGGAGPLGAAVERGLAFISAPFVGGIAVVLAVLGLLDQGAEAAPGSGAVAGSWAAAPAAVPGGARAGAAAEGNGAEHERDMSNVDMRHSRQARREALQQERRQLEQRQRAAAASQPSPAFAASSSSNGSEPGAAPAAAGARQAAVVEGETIVFTQEQLSAAPPAEAPEAEGAAGGEAAAQAEAGDWEEEFAARPVVRPPPLAGEELMADAFQTRYVRWGRLLGALAVLVGGGVLLGRAALLRGAGLPSQPVAAVAVSAAADSPPRSGSSAEAQVALSKEDATSVISQWQQIKREALGPRHAISKLEKILTGPVLEQWRERAASAKDQGWHYVYSAESCQVDSLGAGASPGSVSLMATLRENAQLHKGEEAQEVQRNEYSVAYELTKVGGRWKISAAQVRS